jgi:Leucine-rich repeat (LRR) protein
LAPYEQALAELQKGSADAGEAQALTTLSLAHRGLASIPPLIFESFVGLTTLDLSHNFLSILPDLSPLASSLERLVLSHNLLTCLPSQLVAALPRFARLTHLSLAHNRLPDLSALPYRKLPYLVHLDVSYNSLQALPSRLAKLTQLQHLNLAGNSIGPALSSKLISELTLLEELDLHGCALVGLPPNIDKLSKLRVLDLSNNPIESLPSGLWSLTSLRELYARYVSGMLS